MFFLAGGSNAHHPTHRLPCQLFVRFVFISSHSRPHVTPVQIFSLDEGIEGINDSYWTIRAEEVRGASTLLPLFTYGNHAYSTQ